MKEPITARDLFIISTLCTGFGVLLAWGLFYRWASSPQIKDLDISAWVQAFGTIIAIGIAIAVPHQVYAKERSERMAQDQRIRTERDERDRLETKAIAAELLPVARRFRSEVQGMISDIVDERFEYYSEVPCNDLQSAVDELRSWSPKVVKAADTGELALNAIAYAESALSALSDWEFYEHQTNDGVIEDLERGIYEVFPEPDAPMPILRNCLKSIDECIGRMNAMFG